MVDVQPRWELPRSGFVKINVHSFFSDQRLPNGNISGIGVVARDHKGNILSMLAGSLGKERRRNNEFFAFMEGLKLAYARNYQKVTLESDHVNAYWQWKDSLQAGCHPDDEFIVRQLKTRRRDKNIALEIRLVDPVDNELASYLAQHEAFQWKHMVIIKQPFGRVMEIWNQDMGLGPFGPQYGWMLEEDVNVEAMDDEVVNLELELMAFQVEKPLHAGNVFVGMDAW